MGLDKVTHNITKICCSLLYITISYSVNNYWITLFACVFVSTFILMNVGASLIIDMWLTIKQRWMTMVFCFINKKLPTDQT